MLDRSVQPQIKTLDSFELKKYKRCNLSNGIEVYYVPFGNEDILQIDFMFGAGSAFQKDDEKLVSVFTNYLIRSGCRSMSSSQIDELFDYYGASLQMSCSAYYSYVTLYTLNRHLDVLLPVLLEILQEPTYPEREFELHRDMRIQNIKIEQEKVSYLSARKFRNLLYGDESFYGRMAEIEDYMLVKTDALRNFHKKFYAMSNCKILLCGKVNDDVLKSIDKVFGSVPIVGKPVDLPEYKCKADVPTGRCFVDKLDAVQSSVLIGRKMFNRKHEDYHKFRVLSVLFGGYFGSRLMSNVREDKGYTYGISAGHTAYIDDGHFGISTQCGVEYVEPLVKEVYAEMDRLCNELVSEDELNMVRNYMIGDFLRVIDGGLSTDIPMLLITNGLDYDFFDQRFDTIKTITAQEIRDLAQKYFVKEDYLEVIAGRIG